MATIYGERWEVIESLGEGGQAHTFIVKDLKGQGETQYVLKRLKNLNRIDRFKREIEAVRNLSHENIVRLIDFDLDAPKPYLVTDYCEGGPLSKAQKTLQGNPSKAFELFQQICEGVAYAHSHGIIHRDLKPENIFLRSNDGPAVVGDFGICFVEEDGSRLTITEEAVGPRLYIAPELEDGRVDQISERSDTYSLGKTLYWMLSGGRIFSREKHRESAWDLKGINPDSPSGWNNIYMEHVNRLLDLMIASYPSDRRTVNNIQIIARKTARLVMKEFTPIAKDIAHPCLYCGVGVYKIRDDNPDMSLVLFGLRSGTWGSPNWRFLVCNNCGHIQLFRIDLSDKSYETPWKS